MPAVSFPAGSSFGDASISTALDHELLEELLEAVGPQTMPALVATFMADVAGQLDRLSRAREEGDFGNARRAVHRLRGQFAQFGLSGLAALAREIEEGRLSLSDDTALADFAASALAGAAMVSAFCESAR